VSRPWDTFNLGGAYWSNIRELGGALLAPRGKGDFRRRGRKMSGRCSAVRRGRKKCLLTRKGKGKCFCEGKRGGPHGEKGSCGKAAEGKIQCSWGRRIDKKNVGLSGEGGERVSFQKLSEGVKKVVCKYGTIHRKRNQTT